MNAIRPPGRPLRAGILGLLGIAAALLLPACRGRDGTPPRDAAALAVEAKAGRFPDYWAEVLRLSRRYAAHPDSFRAALDALPGSHLTDEEWKAWTAPWETAPGKVAGSLEEAISTVAPAE